MTFTNFQTDKQRHRDRARKLFLMMESVHDKTRVGKRRWKYLYSLYSKELDKMLIVKSQAA